jgi:predicted nucleic acid-binding protein
MFIDTNIVSNVRKGTLSISTRRASISSVVASELLSMYSGARTAANYYVPVISPLHLMASIGSSKRDHPFSKRYTDRIVYSFGKDFEPVVEFGSSAIARMVNEQNVDLLRQSIAFLEKKEQRPIREAFEFLMENEISCVPLTPGTVRNAYHLLGAYRASGANLKADFRNSWNDMLILSTAQENGSRLLTGDGPLSRFAGSVFGRYSKKGPHILEVYLDRTPNDARSKTNSRESKGYVNKGWRASFESVKKRAS